MIPIICLRILRDEPRIADPFKQSQNLLSLSPNPIMQIELKVRLDVNTNNAHFPLLFCRLIFSLAPGIFIARHETWLSWIKISQKPMLVAKASHRQSFAVRTTAIFDVTRFFVYRSNNRVSYSPLGRTSFIWHSDGNVPGGFMNRNKVHSSIVFACPFSSSYFIPCSRFVCLLYLPSILYLKMTSFLQIFFLPFFFISTDFLQEITSSFYAIPNKCF